MWNNDIILIGIKYYHCHYDCILCVVVQTELSKFQNFFNPLIMNRISVTAILCNNIIYYQIMQGLSDVVKS